MNSRQGIVFAFSLLALIAMAVHAEIYSWTDASGKKHFSDQKPENQKTEAVRLQINTYDEVSFDIAPAPAQASAPTERVVMYSTAWCGYCKKARSYFLANNIPFTEYDIEENASAKQAYDRLGARGVPVILVGQRRMNGFSADGFQQIYRP
jgi:glutaredoxin